MTMRVLREAEWPLWDEFLKGIPESHLRQCSAYGRALRLYGWEPEIVIFEEDHRWVAGSLIGTKPVPFLGGCRVQVSGGIAVARGTSDEAVGRCLDELEAYARGRNGIRLQISWRRTYSIGGVVEPSGESARAVLREKGYEALRATGTYHVRLAGKSPEMLLGSFGRYPRRYVRRAIREGFEITEVTDADSLLELENAHRSMAKRKGLTPVPRGFASQVLRYAVDGGVARLFVVRVGGVTRNMAVVSTVGAPLFSMGALVESDGTEARLPTGPFLHFGIMKNFLDHPAGYYDLGGSPGPEPQEGHPNYTVWQFKRRFNGAYVFHVGEARKALRPRADRMLSVMLAARHEGVRSALRTLVK